MKYILLLLSLMTCTTALYSMGCKITSPGTPLFVTEELKIMRGIIASTELRPPVGIERRTNKEHLEHCFSQVIRFCRILKEGSKDPGVILQLGFNLGRAAGVLQDIGGRQHWWKTFEERFNKSDFDGIIQLIENYKAQLEI